MANPSLEKTGGEREREKDSNPSNWLAVFASLNYVILRIPRETRNSGIKENPSVCTCACVNARLLLLCRLSIPIVSDRLTSTDIRRCTWMDELDGADHWPFNSLSKVLSTYVTKPPLVPNLRPNSLTEKRAKTIDLSFIKAGMLSFRSTKPFI